MTAIKITCCSLCGEAVARTGKPPTRYRKHEGWQITINRFPRGFAPGPRGRPPYAEQLLFYGEACDTCSEALGELLEDAILFIQDREIGR